jgi:hypothetical protein
MMFDDDSTGNVRVLKNTIGDIDVLRAILRARNDYELQWLRWFHFPAPVELLDRWWPEGAAQKETT